MYFFLKISVSLLLIGCIHIIHGQKPEILPIDNLGQFTDSWCWAASTKMILNYYQKGERVSQCQLVGNAFNSKCNCREDIKFSQNKCSTKIFPKDKCAETLPNPNFSLNPEKYNENLKKSFLKIDTILKAYGLNNFKLYTKGELNIDSLIRFIDDKRPIIAMTEPSSDGPAHIVVIKGYETKSSTLNILVNDPLKIILKKNSEYCRYMMNWVDFTTGENLNLINPNLLVKGKSNYLKKYHFNYFLVNQL